MVESESLRRLNIIDLICPYCKINLKSRLFTVGYIYYCKLCDFEYECKILYPKIKYDCIVQNIIDNKLNIINR